MKNLINELNEASKLYYNFGTSPLSDEEFDKKLSLLKKMEEDSSIIYSNSPTQKVGYIILNKLKKVPITEKPMLSLEKVHSFEEINNFSKGKKIIGMIKCDGLSVRLYYLDGKLISANTRGNGEIGGDITEHIKHFTNVPLTIDKKEEYIVDGEAIIKNDIFKKINKDGRFKNPRNTAAGSLNLLEMEEVKRRQLSFIAWDVIKGCDKKMFSELLQETSRLGFETVYYSFEQNNEDFVKKAEELNIPCDGVVWKYEDIEYGKSLGQTSHHFLNAVAFKFYDDEYETRLLDIDWTMGRTGVLTPVAMFAPIEIDGCTVERANLHNLSVMKKLLHGNGWIGQKVKVIKSNEIIPQIVWAEEPLDNSD